MVWQFYLASGLALGIFVLVGLRLYGEAGGRRPYAIYDGPAILLLIAVTAMAAPEPVSPLFKGAVVLGLILVLLGESIRLIPGTPTIVGVVQISLAGALYLLAWLAVMNWQQPTLWGLAVPVAAYLLYRFTARGMGELWFPSVMLMALAACSTWLALEIAVHGGAVWAVTGLAGMICLDAAGAMVALRAFRRGFRGDRLWVALFSAAGHWLMAIAVWGALRWPLL